MNVVQRLAIALLLIAVANGSTPDVPSNDDLYAFSTAWNEWASIANARAARGGTNAIDIREKALWTRTEQAFRQLKRRVDPLYAN